MISQQSLLELLADGQWHSGEALGEAFDVSRAAIWKQLKPLQLSGLEIESERGKGYRLQYPVQLLNAQNIFIGLSSPASQLLSKLDIQFSIDSPQTDAGSCANTGHLPTFSSFCAAFTEAASGARAIT